MQTTFPPRKLVTDGQEEAAAQHRLNVYHAHSPLKFDFQYTKCSQLNFEISVFEVGDSRDKEIEWELDIYVNQKNIRC